MNATGRPGRFRSEGISSVESGLLDKESTMNGAIRLTWVCLLVGASLLPGGASAESIIKTKDGKTVKGTIAGHVVQRGEDAAAGTRTISYNVIPGGAVASIDERGINLTAGTTFRVVVVRQPEAKPDQFNLEFASEFLPMSFDVNMDIGGVGPMAVRTVEGKNLRDAIIGQLEKDGAKTRLVPEIRVETPAGNVVVPLDAIVALSKPGQLK